MIAMVRIFSLGERCNVLFNEAIAELIGTFQLSRNENILPLHEYKHSLFKFLVRLHGEYNILVKLCGNTS